MMKALQPDAPMMNPNASADVILASELNNMTVKDREHVFEEIHGVAPFPEEERSQEALRKSLNRLADALERIPLKPAYDEAQRMAREENTNTFVNHDKYRLKFLRAEQFDTQKAAERMVRNLDLLYRYIGPEGLRRQIRLSDLDEISIAVMKTGSFQLLQSRDRVGRRIGVRIGPLGLDFNKNERSVSSAAYCSVNDSQNRIRD